MKYENIKPKIETLEYAFMCCLKGKKYITGSDI